MREFQPPPVRQVPVRRAGGHVAGGHLAIGLAAMLLLAVPCDGLALTQDDRPVPADTLESWLGQVTGPRSAAESVDSAPTAKPRPEWRLAPFVAVGAIGGLAGTPLTLFIQVAAPLPKPDAAQEPETYVLISGMPPGTSLSKGTGNADGAWLIPLNALTDLTITVPAGFTGTAALTVTAVSDHGGGIVARQSKELVVPIFPPLPDPSPVQAIAAEPIREGDEEPAGPPANAMTIPLPDPRPDAAPAETIVEEPPPTPLPLPVAALAPLPVPTPVPPPALPTPPVVRAAAPRAVSPPPIPEATLMARGDALFAQGDLAAARLFYEMAAAGGSNVAAVALGRTHDPVVLGRMRVRGLVPDADKAAEWYGRAAANGYADAEARLKELAAWRAASPRAR